MVKNVKRCLPGDGEFLTLTWTVHSHILQTTLPPLGQAGVALFNSLPQSNLNGMTRPL